MRQERDTFLGRRTEGRDSWRGGTLAINHRIVNG